MNIVYFAICISVIALNDLVSLFLFISILIFIFNENRKFIRILPIKAKIKQEYYAYPQNLSQDFFNQDYNTILLPNLMILLGSFLIIYNIITLLPFNFSKEIIFLIGCISFLLSFVPTYFFYSKFLPEMIEKNELLKEKWWVEYQKKEYIHYEKQVKSIFLDDPDLAEKVITDELSFKDAKEIKDSRMETKVKKELYEIQLKNLISEYENNDIAQLLIDKKITETVAKSLKLHIYDIELIKDFIEKNLNEIEIEDIYREHYTYEELLLSKKHHVPVELIQKYKKDDISEEELEYIVLKWLSSNDDKELIYMYLSDELTFDELKDICEKNVYEGLSMRVIQMMYGEADHEKVTELKNSTKMVWTYYNEKNMIQNRFFFKDEILIDYELNR